MPKQRKRTIWILLGILTIVLLRLGRRHPESLELAYGEFLFPAIRQFFRFTLSWLPIPAIVIVGVLALLLLYKTAIKPIIKRTWTWKSMGMGFLSTAGAVVFLFYMLWGFNYGRPDVAQRMQINASPLDSVQLTEEFHRATQDLVTWIELHEQEIKSKLDRIDDKLEENLVMELNHVIKNANYPLTVNPRGRLIIPKGILLRFNTAGIYIPFSGEGHVDEGMLPIQVPFVMAHELSHGYGVTDEGDCNFLAYLACRESTDPVIRYSGLLGYWRYVAAEYRRNFREEYSVAFKQLPQLVQQTIYDIHENNALYPDIMPKLRNVVYDTYLKSNGVSDGLISYSRVVRLVRGFWDQS